MYICIYIHTFKSHPTMCIVIVINYIYEVINAQLHSYLLIINIFYCPLQKFRQYVKIVSRNIKQKFTQQSLQNN